MKRQTFRSTDAMQEVMTIVEPGLNHYNPVEEAETLTLRAVNGELKSSLAKQLGGVVLKCAEFYWEGLKTNCQYYQGFHA